MEIQKKCCIFALRKIALHCAKCNNMYKYPKSQINRRCFLKKHTVSDVTKNIRNKFVVIAAVIPQTAMTQECDKPSLTDSIEYGVEMQATASAGDGHTPLWLNANKYGLSSLERSNGYLRATLQLPTAAGSRWGVGYGIDMAAAYNFTSTVIVQQAYIEGRWLRGVLTIGSKQQPMELKNQELSSGPQTLGINARPVPQVRIALPEYWNIPGTRGWLALKGHIAYGMTTDDNWQKDFTKKQSRYTQNALYHSKAGYLRIGGRSLPVSLEAGLEMAALFGGTTYKMDNGVERIDNQGGLKGMWDALIPGGSEPIEDVYQNVGGDQLGSWVLRLSYDAPAWQAAVYWDHFFEDHSAMFHLDYDGYGTGEEWNVKKDNRYFMYGFKDMLLGAELRLKRTPWLSAIVLEYMYTKYQSGPVYHDHTPSMPDHTGGMDNYYNHHIFTGWQHWGQVMGNPLYLSPIYNTDGRIEVKNNRFTALHAGASGDISGNLHYRLLGSLQKGWGTYHVPYPDPRSSMSLMLEACYRFPQTSPLGGWSVTAAAGLDSGELRGTSQGLQMTIRKKWR